ncbi:MAG: thermostable hemolysin [Gammaproteobacteria bacterium]
MRKLLEHPRAVAGMSLERIHADTRVYESEGGDWSLHLVEASHANRDAAQAFIHDAYARVFDADVRDYFPSIITLKDRANGLRGAVGARYAFGQPLFLEQYLHGPVTDLISERTRTPVARDGVVELGNLSVTRPAMTYPFMSLLGGWLRDVGIEWLVFSLTATLRRLFERAGVTMVDLAPADPTRLQPSSTRWGAYYQHDPRIVAIELAGGLVRFNQRHPLPTPQPSRALEAACS